MAGYIVGNIEITDPETYEEYRKLVPPLVEKYGGKYLVRGGPAEQMEGNNPPKRVVVLEFPSLDAAKQFYHSAEYGPVKAIRLKAASGDLWVVEGA